MKILFFYESCDYGGQQTFTFELIKALLEKGHEVEYIYCQDNEAMLDDFQSICKVSKLKTTLAQGEYRRKPWKLLFIILDLRKIFRNHGCDAVISGSGIGSYLTGIARYSLNLKHFRLVGCSLKQVEKVIYNFYSILKVDKFIDGYFGWDEVLRELQQKGVQENKFVKIPYAVNTTEFTPIEENLIKSFREKIGLKEEDIVIGWVGRICKTMQVWDTARLGELLLKKGLKDVKLLFVGGGPDETLFKEFLKERNLIDISILTGWVNYHDVNKYYNAMDIVPLLSKDPQGGSIIREAMSAGKFTISVNGKSQAQSEIMTPDCSVLVSDDNYLETASEEILNLLKEESMLDNLGSNARKNVISKLSFVNLANIIEGTLS